MTREEFLKLKRGDIVLNRASGNSVVIDFSRGETHVGVRTTEITNPSEWDLVNPTPPPKPAGVIARPGMVVMFGGCERWRVITWGELVRRWGFDVTRNGTMPVRKIGEDGAYYVSTASATSTSGEPVTGYEDD